MASTVTSCTSSPPGQHLEASYVDQPVLTPLLAWVSLKLFGVSLFGLRVWPALAAWATVVIAGLTARELGGTRRAQLLAAVAAGAIPGPAGHRSPGRADGLRRAGWGSPGAHRRQDRADGDCRWWLAGGLVLGLGLANKHSVGFFAVALLVGALLSSSRRLVVNRWFLAGALIAAAFAVPRHLVAGTASVGDHRHDPRAEPGERWRGSISSWVIGQVIMTTLALVWVWIAGLRFLWRSERPLWAALAWAYGLLFAFFAVTTGAKIYYLAGAYIYLLTASAVAIDGWLAARPGRLAQPAPGHCPDHRGSGTARPAGAPPRRHRRDLQGEPATGRVHRLAPASFSTVRAVWTSLPPRQRASTVIFTSNYGEASAINELGRGTGLPAAVSGHNTYWWWGPGNPRATTVLAVMPGPIDGTGEGAYLRQFFTSVRAAATLSNPYRIHNQEWGGHVYLCTGPRHPWAQMWPRLRNYG